MDWIHEEYGWGEICENDDWRRISSRSVNKWNIINAKLVIQAFRKWLLCHSENHITTKFLVQITAKTWHMKNRLNKSTFKILTLFVKTWASFDSFISSIHFIHSFHPFIIMNRGGARSFLWFILNFVNLIIISSARLSASDYIYLGWIPGILEFSTQMNYS